MSVADWRHGRAHQRGGGRAGAGSRVAKPISCPVPKLLGNSCYGLLVQLSVFQSSRDPGTEWRAWPKGPDEGLELLEEGRIEAPGRLQRQASVL